TSWEIGPAVTQNRERDETDGIPTTRAGAAAPGAVDDEAAPSTPHGTRTVPGQPAGATASDPGRSGIRLGHGDGTGGRASRFRTARARPCWAMTGAAVAAGAGGRRARGEGTRQGRARPSGAGGRRGGALRRSGRSGSRDR